MNKFKMFWIKVWNVLKKFPVYMSIAILLPTSIYVFRYLFSSEHYYFNLNYDGERINANPSTFEITSIDPLFKIMDISSFSNYQGGACYQNYYALCSNNFECILIYNMDTRKVEHEIFTGMTNTEFHCNTCFFGPTFYSSRDKFPLLYISMENESVESTFAYRIDQNSSQNPITQVQELHLNVDNGEKLYYPNSYYDYSSGLLYYSGYTKKSYHQSEDNILRYYTFKLPDHRIDRVELFASEAEDTFDLPSLTATQGGFISDGYLYQTFSFNSSNDLKNSPKFRLVDLKEKKVVYQVDDLGKINGVYDEFENVAICNNGHMYGFGVKSLKIYDFKFKS